MEDIVLLPQPSLIPKHTLYVKIYFDSPRKRWGWSMCRRETKKYLINGESLFDDNNDDYDIVAECFDDAWTRTKEECLAALQEILDMQLLPVRVEE